MQWEGREESDNVEDRRGMGAGGMAMGGSGGLIVVVVLSLLFGFDPRQVLQIFLPLQQHRSAHRSAPRQPNPAEDRAAHFTKVILKDTEVVWDNLFTRMGRRYVKPKLVLFTGQVRSACGLNSSATGPFYCPPDQRVYIDLSFYRDMERTLNSPGDFARAYVIAHEIGHHVQGLLGYSEHSGSRRSRRGANSASVHLELQADYLAGVWAYHGEQRFHFLEAGDVESALHAAFEIGDDRLQKKSQGYVVPDSFTHGTSQQRQAAFTDGMRSGNVAGASKFFE
jgi:predicted metalloprotease